MKFLGTHPIKMLPYLKETIWGGSKLEKNFGKMRGSLDNIAESWELSAIPSQESIAVSQTQKSESFGNVYKNLNSDKECPILIKFIDSNSDLSIQVHPSEKSENALPKNECWYILSAEEDSKIAYGLKSNATREEIDSALKNGTLCDLLNYVPVKPKDFFYVPAGLIHAIGKGITLLEIQQSSDTTYRLYDYDRTDSNGKKRELHIEKGKDAIKNFSDEQISSLRFSHKVDGAICACDYFSVFEITNELDCSFISDTDNASVTFLSEGSISTSDTVIEANIGETFYIPTQCTKKELVIHASNAVLTVFKNE